MQAAPNIHTLSEARPAADALRVAALRRYQILDTPADADFDFLTALAARLCGVPYALLSLVDAERVWFKSQAGLALPPQARADSYCALALASGGACEIADLAADYRTAQLPLTVAGPRLRRYSSVPLLTPDGHAIGALSVLDTRPGSLAAAQRHLLEGLGRQVMALIDRDAGARELAAARAELEQLSTSDALTGLHNRRSLLHRLQFETARARRFRSPLSALMIELDTVASRGQEHGAPAAGQLMAQLGQLLRDNVRVIDIAGRYSDTVLCVVLPNTPPPGARTLADNLRARIAALTAASAPALHLSASVGIASLDHMAIADAETLLGQAAAALARARAEGGNRVAA